MPRSDLEPLYWGHAKALTCCLLQISLVAILTVAGNPRPQAPSCPRPRNRYRNMFSTYNSRRNPRSALQRRNPRSALQRRALKAAQSKIPSGNSMNTWNFCRKFLPQTVNPKKIHPDSRSRRPSWKVRATKCDHITTRGMENFQTMFSSWFCGTKGTKAQTRTFCWELERGEGRFGVEEMWVDPLELPDCSVDSADEKGRRAIPACLHWRNCCEKIKIAPKTANVLEALKLAACI